MRVTSVTSRDAAAAVVASLGVGPWDAALFGDGSGAGWDRPVGWGCVLVERDGRRRRFAGAMSTGTSYLAELWPFVQALGWYARQRELRGDEAVRRVAVVTDNRAAVVHARRLRDGSASLASLGAAAGPWAALLAYDRMGMALSFHWAGRETTALNCYADAAARVAYRAIRDLPWPATPGGREVSPYECNADAPAAGDLSGVPVRAPKRRRRRGCPPPAADE